MTTTLLRLLSVSALAFAVVSATAAEPAKVEFPRPSPTATLTQRVGVTDIAVTYSRPGMKGRRIFGDAEALVPYGQVWRTGANEATKITFSTPVKLGGADVAAGSYALFTIPDANEWTIILNRAVGDWGAYRYDTKNDVVRVKAAATKLTEPVETFTIDVNDIRNDSATLDLIWATTRVPVKLEIDTVGVLVPQIDAALAASANPSPGLYDNAAMFYLDNGLDLQKASKWIAQAVAKKPDSYSIQYHQARVLAKLGDKTGALAAAHRSIELVSKETGPAKDEYLRLNQALISSLGQ
jgi:hypothetical protein